MRQKVVPADRKSIRQMNQKSLLKLIRSETIISRPQLAALSGLSLATVLSITNDLIDLNLIQESGVAESTGGRKAGLLEVRADGGYALGFKPTEYETICVLMNLYGEVVYSERLPLLLRNQGAQAVELLANATHQVIGRSGIPFTKIVGVGCGLNGFISAEDGRCIDSPLLDWHDVEVCGPLQALLNVPVYMDNDANCLAIYYKLFGAGRPYSQMLSVSIGRGIGMGIIINGDLYRGALGGAGEFGHITIMTGGRSCECGKRGCLEPYVSEPGIIANYLEQLNTAVYSSLEGRSQKPTISEIVTLAQRGDEAAVAAFQRTGTLLGISLANMITIFNPDCLVVSSPDAVIAAGDLLFEPMKAALKVHAFSRFSEHLPCIIEPLGYESWAQGAGSLALSHFFALPEQVHSERLLTL